MSKTDYFDRPGLNWSTLKHALASPKALRHRMAEPVRQTDAMRLGTAMHLAVLEPDAYATDVVRAPDEYVTGSGSLSSAKAAREWLAAQGDALVLTPGEAALIEARRDAVMAHPVASRWVSEALASGLVEVEVEWTESHPVGGDIACKGKLDLIAGGALLDVKNFSPRGEFSLRACEGEIVRRDYHAQLAWYLRGLEATGRPVPERIGWIMVEATAPHDVVCMVADEEMLAYAHDRAQLALDRYADAIASQQWPGIAPDAEVVVSLPGWARIDDDADVAGDLGLMGVQ